MASDGDRLVRSSRGERRRCARDVGSARRLNGSSASLESLQLPNMTDRHTGLPVKLVISLGRVEIVSLGFALAAAVYTVARPAKTSAQPRALPFESVQTDL